MKKIVLTSGVLAALALSACNGTTPDTVSNSTTVTALDNGTTVTNSTTTNSH